VIYFIKKANEMHSFHPDLAKTVNISTYRCLYSAATPDDGQ